MALIDSLPPGTIPVDEDERPLWFLTLTQACNLNCTYCGAGDNYEIEDLSPHPKELTYKLENLKFILKEKQDPVICFYGGEPLVRMNLIKDVMELLGDRPTYVLQSNCQLLNTLPTEILLRFDTILCSIDGDAEVTNANRGKGVYEKCLNNCVDARKRGFSGDLIARMTVSNGHDIYKNVTHLLDLGIFTHVHWQLDVLWDSPIFARWDDYLGWRDTNYNPGITKLVKLFIDTLEKDGKILGIVPILGLLWSYLNNEKVSHIRCSSGYKSFNVSTGGLVTACPIAPEFKSLGDISTPGFEPTHVHGTVIIDGKCSKCDVLHECGGRCLYCNKTEWWGLDGFAEVCNTVKHLLNEVKAIVPRVQALIDAGKVSKEDLHYPRYNNTTEIIP